MPIPQPRHLAVVMFTDIVGYTRIVGEDEALALRTRAALRSVLTDALARRGGTLIQSFGDGTLSAFSSAVEGALAAAEIQNGFVSATGHDLRVGLHLGEVTWDEDGVYGDAVNVAARLEAIAIPGSVLVSEEMSRQLRNRLDLPVVELGAVGLKNVSEPVRVFALAVPGLRTPGRAEIARRAQQRGGADLAERERLPSSLAVLPLVNLSREPAQQYFVDGMHEALLTELARIRALKVISRTSVLRYRDTTVPLSEIALALGVEALIEGSVLRTGDRVRITAQLIALRPERHLWAEAYDGDLCDILALHRSVATAIAQAVDTTLLPREEERLRGKQRVDPEAYEAYLLGRFAAGRLSDHEGQAQAIAEFERAIKVDRGFALPWVGIARALAYLALFGHSDRAGTVNRAGEAIANALALDPSLAEALAARGHVSLIYNADARAAVKDLERAVAQEPNSVPTLIDYGMALNASGRYDDASDAFDSAAERDPLSPTTTMMRGWGRFMGRKFEEARRILEDGARVAPDFSYHHLWLAASLAALGRHAEAWRAAARAEQVQRPTDDVNFMCVIGWIWAALGRPEETRRLRDRIVLARTHGAELDPGFLVVIDSALGDPDSALEQLRSAITLRSPILFHFPGHPFLDPLRRDARFAPLLAEAGLKPLEA